MCNIPSLQDLNNLFNGTDILSQVESKVGCNQINKIENYYKKGCINLGFADCCNTNFNDKIKLLKGKIAENFEKNNDRAMGGRAVLTRDLLTKKEERPSKTSLYKGSIFQTGHILGYRFVRNIEGFNKNPSNKFNIFPQSEWSNSLDMDNWKKYGCTFTYNEQCIANKLNHKKNSDNELKVYYQVDLLYSGDEKVPRAILQQAISNKEEIFPGFIRLVPNIDTKRSINYCEWSHKDNKVNDGVSDTN